MIFNIYYKNKITGIKNIIFFKIKNKNVNRKNKK